MKLRKNTKAALACILILTLILTCASCGGKKHVSDADEPDKTVQAEEPEDKEVSDKEEKKDKEQEKKKAEEKEEEPAAPEEPAEPEPAPAPAPEPAPDPETAPYIAEVNCTTNTVNIYEKDADGRYMVPYKVMLCSTGLDSTPTPKGKYYLTGNRWKWLELIENVHGMYVTQIIGDYLFHSVPYERSGHHGSLVPGEHDKLGSDASHGCVRLQVSDAKWIYNNMYNIEYVNIIDSSDPGPLGKPELQLTAGSKHEGWDPTDPHPDNPWRK